MVCYRAPSGGYGDTNGSYEAYMQANVAYQASQDPEYQALLAKQQALREDDSGAMPPPPPAAEVRPGHSIRWLDCAVSLEHARVITMHMLLLLQSSARCHA